MSILFQYPAKKQSGRPRVLRNLLWFWMRRSLLRHRLPLFASFKLTYRCNLACLACPFHRRAAEPGSHMSWKSAIHCLNLLKRQGVQIVIFEGGEPFLWNDDGYDLQDLVAYAQKQFLRIAVTTNGTFPLCGASDTIWVSIDGLKQNHDRLRSGSFDRILDNLKQTKHPRVMVHFTMNRENWRDLGPLCDLLGKIPSVKGMTVQLFYPYAQGEACLALAPQERRLALENAMQVKKFFPVINSVGGLRSMIDNTWTCRDDLLINVDPDGTVTQGCYVRSRGEVCCRQCGFTPVAEASRAMSLRPASLLAGWRAYLAEP